MRVLMFVAIGAIGGFLAGIVLSEIIGITGYVISGHAVGVKYLSLYLALVGAIAVPLVGARRRRSTRADGAAPRP